MILESFSGLLVSIIVIISFLSIKYLGAVNKWILATSKFIYYSGHPVLDDDSIYEQITKRFKGVFTTLVVIIGKTIVFLLIILLVIALASFLVSVIRKDVIPNFDSPDFITFLFPKYVIQLPFIIGTLIPIFLMPILLKNKKNIKSTYSPLEQFLHYIFLGNKNIAKLLFRIELKLNRKKLKQLDASRNIYVSGMARAGTTVLMQYLGQLNEFRSLSYKNLPFLFLPKTWPKLISKKKFKEKERFHQDGIKHSINSYEALEEPFWRNYIGQKYIQDETIIEHSVDKEVFDKYNAFRKLIAGDKIYLAKNNNHLLRAESLHELDKIHGNKTITIIPFRDPYEQSKSLLKQHNLLSSLQNDDEFTLDYMDFLVHHEFGLHTKVPLFDKNELVIVNNGNLENIGHWLEIWYLFYAKVYEKYSTIENVYFFCYESFVNEPKESLEKLLIALDLPKSLIHSISIKTFNPVLKDNENELKIDYTELYKKLTLKAIN